MFLATNNCLSVTAAVVTACVFTQPIWAGEPALNSAAKPIQPLVAEAAQAEQPANAALAVLFASPTNSPSSLIAEVRTESGPGIRTARRAYLSAGTNRFAFLVPEGFRMDTCE